MIRVISVLIFISAQFVQGCQKDARSPLLSYRNAPGAIVPVTTMDDWSVKRRQILERIQLATGKLPDHRALAPVIFYRDSLRTEKYTRFTISLTVADSEDLPAYLYVPSGGQLNGKHPAMLVLHETGDAGKQLVDTTVAGINHPIAKELADRGYVVIAPDYPSMGGLKDYDFEKDRYQSGTMKGIFDHIRCVDLLAARPDVDASRIGVIGHSLGGHNAMFVAVFDPRLKVIVSSCGWTLFDFYNIGAEASKKYGGRLGPWAQDRYMPLLREVYYVDPAKIPFDFDEVIAALAPRPFFSNSPSGDSNFDPKGVRVGIAAASNVYRFLNAGQDLHVSYPDCEHDFPEQVRAEAYRFIDKALQHTPGGENN